MKIFPMEEFRKFLLGLLSTASGVLIALLINSCVSKQKELATYHSMLIAVKIEAEQNEIVYRQSFKPNFEKGIVRREFSIDNCDNYLNNEIFLKYIDQETLKLLMYYSLSLNRANNFRKSDEQYKYQPDQYKKWSADLTIAFERVLDTSKSLIDDVLKINTN